MALRNLAERYLAGATLAELAAPLGITPSGLYKRLLRGRYIPRAPKSDQSPAVSQEDFVRAWNESDNIAQVLVRTGMKYRTTLSRATNYRRRGIDLKYMPGTAASVTPDEIRQALHDARGRSTVASRALGKSETYIVVAAGNDPAIAKILDDARREFSHTHAQIKYTCANCGERFVPAHPAARYCSETCKRSAANARNYARRKVRNPATDR